MLVCRGTFSLGLSSLEVFRRNRSGSSTHSAQCCQLVCVYLFVSARRHVCAAAGGIRLHQCLDAVVIESWVSSI